MPLIVETGTGVANADSLASIAFIDEYHAARGNGAWAAISTIERKEQLARRATDYLRVTYYGAWIGVAAFLGNNLPFPRNPLTPREFGLYELGVPLEVKQALAELALIANTVALFPNPSTTRGKKRVKVGPIEVEYDSTSGAQNKFVGASMLLIPFLKRMATTNMAKLIRA